MPPQNQLESFKELWLHVLFQAMQDIIRPKGNPREKRLYRESALYWINDRENEEINSFIGICEVLNTDPDKVRVYILNVKRKGV
jgi:hypothetical protein